MSGSALKLEKPKNMNMQIVLGVGVMGAVIAAGAYVLWGPDTLLKRRGRCAGLQNLGNTCFMNALLQALASAGCLVAWLRATRGGRLTSALQQTLTSLCEDDGEAVTPAPILQALAWHGWLLDFQQQDAHELYHIFLTCLAEERVNCPSLLADPPPPLLNESKYVAYGQAGPIPSLSANTTVVCPVQGLLASELVCLACQQLIPVTYEVFDSLSLNLPLALTQCSLHSCLLDFIKSEVVADVECSSCSKLVGSKVKKTFMKRLSLARVPRILCLHLKRTVWLPSGNLHKCSVTVAFPSHLDLSSLCKTKVSGCKYELVAMIEHLGGPFSGHYVTYRQLEGRQWVYTSDTAVYSSSLHHVLNSNPYMLFYQQVSNS